MTPSAAPPPDLPDLPDVPDGLGTTGVAVVVLTGGASTRMGAHKPALDVGGQPIVQRVLDAVAGWPVVVVGRDDAVPPGLPVVREHRPGGGPVAGIAAGLGALAGPDPGGPGVVLVLASDLPFLTRQHLDRLVHAAGATGPRVAVTVDAHRRNWLCAAWPTPLLAAALRRLGPPEDRSVRALVGDLPVSEVPDVLGAATDVDTPADLARARARVHDARQP